MRQKKKLPHNNLSISFVLFYPNEMGGRNRSTLDYYNDITLHKHFFFFDKMAASEDAGKILEETQMRRESIIIMSRSSAASFGLVFGPPAANRHRVFVLGRVIILRLLPIWLSFFNHRETKHGSRFIIKEKRATSTWSTPGRRSLFLN